MSNESQNNKRLAKNTLILYARMMFTVGINFYSTRLVLANLGVLDYGVYNVVGGFVTMFYMITSAMVAAVCRFLTFELGKGDAKRLQQTFSTSVNILFVLAMVIILLAETIGLWFVNSKLNIEPDRIIAANWVYQFALLSFILEMISAPYNASVFAHEKMGFYAFITIIKVLFTFSIALLLTVISMDKLIFYGALMFIVSFSIQIIYWGYCKKNFPECRYTAHIDKSIFKDMFGFATWHFLTACSSILCTQGVSIILNMYLGTAINAARGIATQISSTAGSFSKNFTTALNPQIIKSYASGNLSYTTKLVCEGAKFSYLLLLFIALPCMLEVDFFLSKWLTEVPPYTGIFVQLILVNALVEILLSSNEELNRATGKIRNLEIIISVAQLLILIFSYIVLDTTGNPVLTVATTNIIYLLMFVPRIMINTPFSGITFGYFFKHVLKGILLATGISSIICIFFQSYFEQGWFRLLGTCIVSTIVLIISSWGFVLTNDERNGIKCFIKKKYNKVS
ncbi:MAG: lipopolysaccharide biosynthesis protein [Prevotella sp.]|nr:lipopolysaccharide biosynthesis protein [Prevotella sp.]